MWCRAKTSRSVTRCASTTRSSPAMSACRATFAGKRVSSSACRRPIRSRTLAAHNLHAQDEPTYDVRFRTEDLWPQMGLVEARLKAWPFVNSGTM
jgi:hypothetical protein